MLELKRMFVAGGLTCVALGTGGVGGKTAPHVFLSPLAQERAWREGDPRPPGHELPPPSTAFENSHDFWCSRDLREQEMRGVLMPEERRIFPCEPHGAN